MISFITKHHIEIPSPLPVKPVLLEKIHIEIPSPLPVKPVLLEKICGANIPKKYVIDKMVTAGCQFVLCLPPCHCVFKSNRNGLESTETSCSICEYPQKS